MSERLNTASIILNDDDENNVFYSLTITVGRGALGFYGRDFTSLKEALAELAKQVKELEQ